MSSKSEYLFNVQKKYSEAISVLEKLNASPVDVVGLYPDIMDNVQDFQSEKEALQELGLYLSKERVKLITYRNELAAQMNQKAKNSIHKNPYFDSTIEDSLSDCKFLLEFAETALLQVYLTTNSSLLGSLLRVENSCNYERTVALLIRFKKNNELIDFYKAKGQHQKALTFMKMYRWANIRVTENDDYVKMISYLQQLDLNKHVDTLKIFEFLDSISPEYGLEYLENLVNSHFDDDVNINTKLLLKYMRMCIESPKDQLARDKFETFIHQNTHYNESEVLDSLPKKQFLIERTHILSRLDRFEEALEIFIYDIQDFKLAEEYCIRHYKHHRSLSKTLFTYLYRLYIQSENKNDQETLKYLNNHGYRLDACKVIFSKQDYRHTGIKRKVIRDTIVSNQ
ncbi:Vam6/Vps39-like protein [Terramyces sp. JEL0728]|nr:Vam6/Vps39-like protein [Terramyces sp. JEL0728]